VPGGYYRAGTRWNLSRHGVPALLFDLDGTLVDSLYVLAWRRP
jgi:hypothetical protein